MLEIGPGTGANLEFFPKNIALTVLEPSPYMQKYLRDKAAGIDMDINIHTGYAENMPFEKESFDAVITTLVLCSVDDLKKSLSEIYRVLKPGGTFYFMEHVAAAEESWLHTLQNWITPLWKRMAEGCHPNRNTSKYILKAGFREVEIERTRVKLPVVSPHIIGKATKPA